MARTIGGAFPTASSWPFNVHRTGPSAWFGVVTSYRKEHGRERVVDVADVRARTREEAIAADARLMAYKAHWHAPTHS